jgi:hypothetical protein
VAAGLVLVVVDGSACLASVGWPTAAPPIGVASAAPSSDGGLLDRGPSRRPAEETWTGRVAAKWSIVAFLRADPVSRHPLDLRQEEVTLFLGPVHPPISRAPEYCDTVGPTRERSAAELPTSEVRFLGIAFPTDQSVVVDGVRRLGEAFGAIPVELGRIPSGGASEAGSATPSPRPDRGSAGPSGTPAPDPVRMFGFPGGGPWPDGLYRFDVVTGVSTGQLCPRQSCLISVSGRRPSTPSRRRSRGASRSG